MQIGDQVRVHKPDPAYPFHKDVGTVVGYEFGWVVVRWDYTEEGWVEEEFHHTELVGV